MANETKKRAGRKQGYPITRHQFDDLMAALGGTHEEVARLCGKSLGPQAVSWWRQSERIPFAHLNRLASELVRQLQSREPTEIDKRALQYLKTAKALIDASGTAVKDPRSAIQLQPEIQRPSLGVSLEGFKLEELVEEIEKRGWDVNLSLRKIEGR
ncbi:MAG: hypothetical protein A4S09_17290 [Proteobacteria bacterium SG_bin7]|nr:MAG: hypothetical protein A4S09_17290 [Proteobacteria bacterium SG_bin7]